MHPEEWTEVASKGRRKKNEYTATLQVRPNNPPSRTLTLANVQADFNLKMKSWQTCSCRKTVLGILSRIQPDDGWDIGQAVCIGSGSFSRDNLECRRRSVWQFVVFVDLARELQKRARSGADMRIFAQEPEYTDMDKQFLSTMDIMMLQVVPPMERPGGLTGLGPAKEQLDHRTFLFEPFMDMDAGMVTDVSTAGPVLYIGSSMKGLLAKRGEAADLAKLFHDQHENYHFPRFEEDPNVLEGLSIYWKPDEEEDS